MTKRETATPALQMAAEQATYARLIRAAADCRKKINRLKARLRKHPEHVIPSPPPVWPPWTRVVNAIAGQSPQRGVGVTP